MREYLTIFPFVTVDGQRDIWMMSPELELAALGYEGDHFCKRSDGVDIAERKVTSVGFSLVLDVGMVAVVSLFDNALALNDGTVAAFGADGRQILIGDTRRELLVACSLRLGEMIAKASPAVRQAATAVDVEASLRTLVSDSTDPGDLADYQILRAWALDIFDSPSQASPVRPGIFTSASQSFAERATATIAARDQLAARAIDHFESVVMSITELVMLMRAELAMRAAGFGDDN